MGNKLGWILAGGIVLVVGIVIAVVVFFPSHSEPTIDTTRPGVLNLLNQTEPLTTVMPESAVPTGAGNAADDYVQAWKLYQAHESALKDLPEHMDDIWAAKQALLNEQISALEAIQQAVAAGAAKQKMQFVGVHTPKQFTVGYRYRPAESFVTLAKATEALAGHFKVKKYFPAAQKILWQQLIMGRQLVDERARPYTVLAGIDIQAAAISALYRLRMGDAGTAKALQQYLDSLDLFRETYVSKLKILQVIKPHPGDVYNIIEKDADRAWRVQGLLTLGLLKFTVTSRGDVKNVNDLIAKYSSSDDPLQAAAATAAGAMTREQLKTYAVDDRD